MKNETAAGEEVLDDVKIEVTSPRSTCACFLECTTDDHEDDNVFDLIDIAALVIVICLVIALGLIAG
mgnify:CR=1 FL=1